MKSKLFDLGSTHKDYRPEIEKINKNDIAIIGMSGKFPQANNIREYWRNLIDKIDCISNLNKIREEDVKDIVNSLNLHEEEYQFLELGYLDNIDKFNYDFFNLSPKEAELMDPTQRLFLETSWSILEDAGYGGGRAKSSKTGVFLGYSENSVINYRTLIYVNQKSSYNMATPGNLKSITASRIAYLLDLKGPAIVVDTACSSSLVAVHLACRSIKNGDCDMALVGGINLYLVPIKGSSEIKIGIESSNNRTRTFDDSSDGTSMGEGVGGILIKPLYKALEDGDHIYAVIKGSAINQDGHSMSLTSPNPAAQADVILSAWKDAGIDPTTITYIEAHGTGTKLGDPVEISAIQQAFSQFTEKKQFCAVGSVKSNIGHLDSAAGIAGIIKASLALQNKEIPATLHFNYPNKQIDFMNSPVYISDEHHKWSDSKNPLRCGVSSFGMSGTNCHIVMEEAPISFCKSEAYLPEYNLLPISSKDENSLRELVQEYIYCFEDIEKYRVEDVCFTASTGRGHYNTRLIIMFKDWEDLKLKLQKILGSKEIHNSSEYIFFTNDIKNRVKFLNHGKSDEEIICESYINGANIDWEALHSNGRKFKVSLPSYPFNGKRCWIKSSGNYVKNKESDKIVDLLYSNNWKEEKQGENFNNHECIMIIRKQDQLSNKLITSLRKDGKRVIVVNLSTCFQKIDNEHYTIGHTIEDYETLFKNITLSKVSQIIHMSSLSSPTLRTSWDELEDKLNSGLYNLYSLYKTLCLQTYSHKIEIAIITDYAQRVDGTEEIIRPENATIIGFGKALSMESLHINFKNIDIDVHTTKDEVIEELNTSSSNYQVAYRRGIRWVIELEKAGLTERKQNGSKLVDDGVYIVTGGAGGIGLEVCKYIASNAQVKIVVLARSEYPQKKDWKNIMESSDDDILKNKLRAFEKIENEGSQIYYYSVDISDYVHTKKVIKEIKNRFGKINGIFHTAGVSGNGFAFNKNIEEIRNVLRPKVQGAWILHELTKTDHLDFFVMFSSLTSIVSAPGQSDYTAANCFLDSLSMMRQLEGLNSISINWGGWKEVGMSVDHNLSDEHSKVKLMGTQKALNALDYVIHSNITNIAVLEIDHQNLDERDSNCAIEIIKESRTTIEIVSSIWNEILGRNNIDIDDDFVKAGGNSISAINLISQIQQQFKIELPQHFMIEVPTIKRMTNYLEENAYSQTTIIEDIEPFNTLYFSSCFYNSLFPILKKFDIDIMTVLINNIVLYEFNESKPNDFLDIEYITCSPIEEILKQAGVGYHTKNILKNPISEIKNSINQKHPVILWVDCYYESIRKDTYLQKHQDHTLLIYGYNDKLKEFNIIEQLNGESLSYRHCTISYIELEKAYQGYMKTDEIPADRPSFYEFFKRDEYDIQKKYDFNIIYSKNILSYKQKIIEGLDVLMLFCEKYKNEIDEEKLLKKNGHIFLGTMNEIINGKKAERYIFENLMKDNTFDELISLNHSICTIWSLLRIPIGRYLFGSKYNKNSFVESLRRIEEIIEKETLYYNKLFEVLEINIQSLK